jgi:hypothetical protein
MSYIDAYFGVWMDDDDFKDFGVGDVRLIFDHMTAKQHMELFKDLAERLNYEIEE